MCGLVCRKAADARAVLVSDSYQEALKRAVLDGTLDAAESPAAVLNDLITRVSMPGEQVRMRHLWPLLFGAHFYLLAQGGFITYPTDLCCTTMSHLCFVVV